MFSFFQKEEPKTQVDTMILAIRKNPGITRPQLIDLKHNGLRIANITSSITKARKKLKEFGETIICDRLPIREIRGMRVVPTSYRIGAIVFTEEIDPRNIEA